MHKILLISIALLPLVCGCSAMRPPNAGPGSAPSNGFFGSRQNTYPDEGVKNRYWDLQQQQRER
jgi:hypothetical protein